MARDSSPENGKNIEYIVLFVSRDELVVSDDMHHFVANWADVASGVVFGLIDLLQRVRTRDAVLVEHNVMHAAGPGIRTDDGKAFLVHRSGLFRLTQC